MKVILLVALGLSALTTMPNARAQFVKGNEAVTVAADRSRKVETPPTTGALLAKPCPATDPACSGGGWKMVETKDGLMECTEVYARRTTCRRSTYGSEKRARVWVVKSGAQWKHCSYPDMSKGCTSIKSLPSPVVQ
ncbi:MAG: hypothetical protein F9K36_16880 [Burkholderiaceae bacterium]|nr:MAG: hypothetical protein F9K36_16880 [Burkholderiaceae bacterium]